MKREEALKELVEMFLVKKNHAILLDKMTAEIDIKARQIELKSSERTKLILQAEEVINHKNS